MMIVLLSFWMVCDRSLFSMGKRNFYIVIGGKGTFYKTWALDDRPHVGTVVDLETKILNLENNSLLIPLCITVVFKNNSVVKIIIVISEYFRSVF